MKTQLEMLKKKFDFLDDFKIVIDNRRCDFPTALIYPYKKVESEPGKTLLVVNANKPSLVRYGLIDLLVHEIAHCYFMKECPEFSGDVHENLRFQEIERELKEKVNKEIIKEHGEI